MKTRRYFYTILRIHDVHSITAKRAGLLTCEWQIYRPHHNLNPNVAKVGGLQSQVARGEVIVNDYEPLITQQMEASDSPFG
jgi:hypothetical protein